MSASAPSASTSAEGKGPVRIGTHDGTFHADEACAIYLLKLLPRYAHAEVTRTRDPTVLATMDMVVDVGGVYDASKHRYDHHQREFKDTLLPNYHTRLSSAGLVYKHFGREIIKTLAPSLTDAELEILFDRTYRTFVEAMDGHDNGVNQYPADIAPAYVVNTDLPSRVSRLNPAWNEEVGDGEVMKRFHKAMALTGTEFVENVMSSVNVWLPARQIVKAAYEARATAHASGQIMVLKQYTSWQSHMYDVERELAIAEGKEVYYVVYRDTNKSWRVQCVPVSGGSFVSRKPLPEAWRGVRDDLLSGVANIPGCVFCHATGFIAGNATFEGAIAMAAAGLAGNTPVNTPAPKPVKGAAAAASTASAAAEPALKKQKTDAK